MKLTYQMKSHAAIVALKAQHRYTGTVQCRDDVRSSVINDRNGQESTDVFPVTAAEKQYCTLRVLIPPEDLMVYKRSR